MIMEHKIGDIFEYKGEWYQCVEDTEDISCVNCCFYNGGLKLCTDEDMGACVKEYRSDAKSICFKKLEKVGEQSLYKGKQMQSYIRATDELICNWNNNLLLLEHGDSDIIDIEIKQNKEDMEDLDKIKVRDYTKVEDLNVMEENKLNLKPFDIQKAREGKPVCTRDGRKARIICFDAKRKDEKNIIALVPSKDYPGFEDLIAYPNNGNYHGGYENDGDLMMLPEKKEGWIVIHKEAIYDKETAEKIARETTSNVIRIQKIEWEE